MAYLEAAYLTGDVQRYELSKQQPVSIGNHKTNDISIDEADVELMHCRVSWNKTGYEAVAAGVEPIDVNGNLVQRALLKSGDVVRIGTVDISFQDGNSASSPGAAKPEADESQEKNDFGLKPITGELPSFLDEPDETVSDDARKKPPAAPKSKSPPPEEPDDVDEGDLLDDEPDEETDNADWLDDDEDDSGGGLSGLDALAAESRVDTPSRREMPDREGGRAPADDESPDALSGDEEPEEEQGSGESLSDRLREAVRRQQHRPGEEDSLRSPVVLGLVGGAAVLVLLGVTFFFIANRQTTQQAYDVAADLLAEQKYAAAITAFDEFILVYRDHPLADEARIQRDLAKVDQQIRGAVPDWTKGLEALRNYINEHRDSERFAELESEVRDRAAEIAQGAAAAAGRSFNRDLLEVSEQALTVFSTYQDDAKTTQLFQDITTTARQSTAAILRNETYNAELAKLDQAIQDGQPMLALATRRDLLTRYPDYRGDAKLAAKLQETLETERSLVRSESLDRTALTDEPESETPPPLTLAFHARSETDAVSVNEAVCVVAKDCCYGVDTITGRPIWRRVVGLDAPFFPVRESSLPSVVLYDTKRRELVRLNQNTGELVWRQPIGEDVSGAPLLHEGQIYLTTRGGHLYKIDLQSGTASTRLTFSQEVTGPVALTDGAHLVVAGDREVVYTLSRQPLECIAVSFLSQKQDSIETPLLTMGPYVLMVENGSGQTAQLRLLNASNPSQITETASADVSGRVLDDVVIRGRDLFVPSTNERVTAFTVSDDEGQPPLVLGPGYEVKGAQRSPIFLTTGPDRQLWMASSALRKLQLTADALEADQAEQAVGISSQPLQYTGGMLFNARRRPFTDAVTFTQRDRTDLSDSDWQVVLGAEIIAWSATEDGEPSLTCITEAGHTFRVREKDWTAGGFLDEAADRVPIDDEVTDPIIAVGLDGGKAAIAIGGEEPMVRSVTQLAKLEGRFPLEAPLQAEPAVMGDRLILPVAGKLQASYGPGLPRIQDFALPSDQAETSGWRQVLPVDDETVVAVTESGQLIQIRRQTNPRSHLGEVSRSELGAAVDVTGDSGEGTLVIASADQRLRLFDSANLDVKAERSMEQPVSGPVWLVGTNVFVETADAMCHCLDAENGLQPKWASPLDLSGSFVADRPALVGDRIVLARGDGTIVAVNAGSGEPIAQLNVESAVTKGPIAVGGAWFVATLDGSLVNVTQISKPE